MSTTGRTPHLTMASIAARAADDLARTEETAEQHYLGAPVPDHRAAVDAVIAAHDRKVAKKAAKKALLTDAVIEAAARVLTIPSRLQGIRMPVCMRHRRLIFNEGCHGCIEDARAVLTAAIAAFKEAKG